MFLIYRFKRSFGPNVEFDAAAGKATERIENDPVDHDAATEWLKIASKLEYATSFDLAKTLNFVDEL